MKDRFAAGEFGEHAFQFRSRGKRGLQPLNPRFERIRAHRIAAVGVNNFVLDQMQPD